MHAERFASEAPKSPVVPSRGVDAPVRSMPKRKQPVAKGRPAVGMSVIENA